MAPELQVPPAERENTQDAAMHKSPADHEMVCEMFTVYMVLMPIVAKCPTRFYHRPDFVYGSAQLRVIGTD
jgi:hypothetical protein